MTSQAQIEFHELVESVDITHRPFIGWHSEKQLPTIPLEDIACILRAHPEVMDDVRIDAGELAGVIEDESIEPRHLFIARVVMNQVIAACKHQLFVALMFREERDYMQREEEDREYAHTYSDHGEPR